MRGLLALVLSGVLLLAATAARAQGVVPGDFRFALTAGLTGGGDKLATATFRDGSTQSIRAGGLVQIGAGVLWQPAGTPLAVQATFNYHVDSVNASNGDLRFSRYPVEVLGFYTGLGPWRIGGGARFVLDPSLTIDVPGTNLTVDFEDTIGAVLEAGYQFGRYVSVNLRYTVEKYKPKTASTGTVATGSSVSGDSVGLNVVFSF